MKWAARALAGGAVCAVVCASACLAVVSSAVHAQAAAPRVTDNSCAKSLGPQARQVTQGDLTLAWLPEPAPIPRDRHFTVQLRVCSPQPWVVERVDADMPAHRHGMNYRATLQPAGAQTWRAEGLMFHMSGRWRLLVDLSLNGERRRVSDELELR